MDLDVHPTLLKKISLSIKTYRGRGFETTNIPASDLINILDEYDYSVVWFDKATCEYLRIEDEPLILNLLGCEWGHMPTSVMFKYYRTAGYGEDYSDHEKFCKWVATYSGYDSYLNIIKQTEYAARPKDAPERFAVVENDEGIVCIICIFEK